MHKKLEKVIHIVYTACICTALIFIIYILTNIKNDIITPQSDDSYVLLTPTDYVTIEDSDYPLGVYNVVSLNVENILKDSHLIFFTTHEAIDVFIGDELVYSLHPNKTNAFTKTTGPNWYNILLSPQDSGKSIRIVLSPLYKNMIGYCPEFYLGSELRIYTRLVLHNIPVFITGLIAVVAGVACIAFALAGIHNRRISANSLILGLFSIFIGIWKITDINTTALIFPASIALSYVTYLCLMLLAIPFVLFVKDVCTDNHNIIWYIPCIASVAVFFVMIILQVAGVADLRQNLWMVHIIMLCVIPIVFIMFYREIRANGWSRRLKQTFICMVLCLIGLIADVATYYISGSTYVSSMGMLGFLVYIVVFSISSYNNARQLMAAGKQARHYEEIAYHDQLTGLYNRTAYADFISRKDFNPEGCIIAMFDLNNLKTCNDTYGHEQGDVYISAGARLIHESFGQLGNCYRMGGDEFCTIMFDTTLKQCSECAAKLKDSIATYNDTHSNDFSVNIAYGYTMYDSRQDYDIGDTLRRADRIMYNCKFNMKHKDCAATTQ